ncbi:hypothetical protein DM01DRAFT_122434 [Hesseltinella vesiculosa]|uniref:Uncharacterized protein n=1 Tax=Hesseltinella vesiculosa TaxID=101127 RepID=A0A1X2GDQ2_9FUNG|nr:hypothetical protein DM01DRAFT_122434 [Hesseltinella vesiculosa]
MNTSTIVTFGILGMTAAHIGEDDATGDPQPDHSPSPLPHLHASLTIFFTVMANMPKNLEALDSCDQEEEPTPQQRPSPAWTRHFLAELPERKKLHNQKRSRRTLMLTKMINDNAPLVTSHLSPQFVPQSLDAITQKVESLLGHSNHR